MYTSKRSQFHIRMPESVSGRATVIEGVTPPQQAKADQKSA
jgi:hypothetical protein